MRDFRFFVRRYHKMLIISLLILYICYFPSSISRQCSNTWSNTQELYKKAETELDKFEYSVLIASAPDNYVRRDTIRATWMKLMNNIATENGVIFYKWNHTWKGEQEAKELAKFFFAVSTDGLSEEKKLKLVNENSKSGDLLLLNGFVDSYNTLSTKMLHSLEWISYNMKRLKYLIKCDDDSFLRIDLIINDLDAFAPAMDAPEISEYISHKVIKNYKGLYWGYFNGGANVFKRGKWEEKNWFLCDRYLPYALGGGYVISRSIIDFIARNYEDLSRYNSEDVSMGVWTSALDGINRVHDLRFDTSATSRGCSDDMLVRHKQSPKDMFTLYKTLVNSYGEKLCKNQNVTKQYMYDWNVSPSMCCKR